MNPTLSISVLAHPKREEFFPYLAERLNTTLFSVEDGRGLMKNADRAWRMYDPACDWHLVVEDDALVCLDFHARIIPVLRHAMSFNLRAVNLYYGALPGEKQAEEGRIAGFVVRPSLNWGVGICLRTELINEALDFVGSLPGAKMFDASLSQFLISRGAPTYYPIPSLLDHRHGESIIGGDPERKAFAFIDR
jgi:hypothetical protein